MPLMLLTASLQAWVRNHKRGGKTNSRFADRGLSRPNCYHSNKELKLLLILYM